MQVILKPLSRPDLGDIVIDGELFPVGRSETPFTAYPPDSVVHLSRRHARIFIEDGGAYVADLGSRNGTRLNDKPVEFRPVRLLHGDRLSFARQLDYTVSIQGDSAWGDEVAAPDLTLTLEPVEGGSSGEQITVSSFPFLVGKSDPAFAASDYLSRRHAHFFLRGQQLCLEDLGSTNGTFVNGERLDEHARSLADGDLIQFGGNRLSYRVKLDRATDVVDAGSADDDECRTTFVTTADSFLDIFCTAEEAGEPEAVEEQAGEPSAEAAAPPGKSGPLRRLRTFGGELKAAFGEVGPGRTRHRWLALGGVAAIAAVFLGVYWSGSTERRIEQLLAHEHYLESARLANAYLADHPDAEQPRELGGEALLKYAVGAWLPTVEANDFAASRAVIAQSRPLAMHNRTATTLLDLLEWNTDLHQFIIERGGADAPVRLYEQETQINELVDWWEQDSREHRNQMALLATYVPDFAKVNATSFSYLRTLRNEQSIYLAAIDKLDAEVRSKLHSDDPAALRETLAETARQYPRLRGLDRLRADLDQYLPIHAALAQGDRLQAAITLDRATFVTPPFIARAQELREDQLPSADVTRRYREASAAWRAGELQRALELLEALSNGVGGELATRELAAKQKIIAAYAQLQQYRDAPDYGERLLAFHSTLDPVEDRHFIEAVSQDFQRQRDTAKANADRAWDAASQSWRHYRSGGGIRGLLRLEEQVSSRFREQADLLRKAESQVRYGRKVYELLNLALGAEQQELYRDIEAESTLQRRSLEQLSMVLSPDVLDAKLAMLPESGDTSDNRDQLE